MGSRKGQKHFPKVSHLKGRGRAHKVIPGNRQDPGVVPGGQTAHPTGWRDGARGEAWLLWAQCPGLSPGPVLFCVPMKQLLQCKCMTGGRGQCAWLTQGRLIFFSRQHLSCIIVYLDGQMLSCLLSGFSIYIQCRVVSSEESVSH